VRQHDRACEGSVGLQTGADATDFVFLVMNDRGGGSLLCTKVKLGADACVPLRSAQPSPKLWDGIPLRQNVRNAPQMLRWGREDGPGTDALRKQQIDVGRVRTGSNAREACSAPEGG
jgi:hypothetical protein